MSSFHSSRVFVSYRSTCRWIRVKYNCSFDNYRNYNTRISANPYKHVRTRIRFPPSGLLVPLRWCDCKTKAREVVNAAAPSQPRFNSYIILNRCRTRRNWPVALCPFLSGVRPIADCRPCLRTPAAFTCFIFYICFWSRGYLFISIYCILYQSV